MPLSIYLAGPGVFRPDALAWGEQLKAACAEHGFTGLFPLDNAVREGLDSAAQRQWIFEANCALIRQADLVLADMRAFRSASEPDSGTAFEIGYAHALGKPVWLWLPDTAPGATMLDRAAHARDGAGRPIDQQGWHVEDFGAPLNLMLWQAAAGAFYAVTPREALQQLVARLGR
ncbi:nucleoside 2-deoxyribosyltransferase [Chitinolyticbacter meiyuanensis]|uniref:nucleoside 2-deoxyribosyltransferase n=1 Tax=Chitinolyticbacter meiyuanensis TaxID=682798 RepID=UPI0011E5FE40|nr:nucleoside 2-deoxyribosyltransferase [Chitinolyticbacter meiyuanensis]